AKNEGAKFWLSVMTELKNRGLQDIFIACCDGLKGFPEAIEAVYPQTQVQLCLVHQVRHSLRYVGWKERKAVAADLRAIYNAANLEAAEHALEAFSARWDYKYPTISQSWRNNWERLIVIFDFAPEIRKAIYTTNAIESLNGSLRKITKTRRVFPTDESVLKLLYLALHNISAKWTMPIQNWKPAMSQFMLMYGERVPQ
ncbi:IS256 family transposase, partial [Salmonella enterica]|nr:IS256 family transposase [Salmonella enterica]